MPHKHGDALLAGLLRCRRCGRKLTLRYSGVKNHRGTANDCRADLVNEGERFAGNYARLVVWSRGGAPGPSLSAPDGLGSSSALDLHPSTCPV
jgi:hypothetical protein